MEEQAQADREHIESALRWLGAVPRPAPPSEDPVAAAFRKVLARSRRAAARRAKREEERRHQAEELRAREAWFAADESRRRRGVVIDTPGSALARRTEKLNEISAYQRWHLLRAGKKEFLR